MQRDVLTRKLDELLQIKQIEDTSLNGLQVRGKSELQHLAFAVTANQYTIKQAAALKVDGLIVHHGLFWKHHVQTITGSFYQQIAPLLKQDINLWGYHLPLDGHPEVGNNACLAHALQLSDLTYQLGPRGEAGIACRGILPRPSSVAELRDQLTKIVQHPVQVSTGGDETPITQVVVVSGGGASYLSKMSLVPGEVVLTGEAAQHHWHYFPENGHRLFLLGHEASEVFGVQALAKLCAQEGLQTSFIPDPNPL